MTNGVKAIQEERERQIEKGYSKKHDQTFHKNGELLDVPLGILLYHSNYRIEGDNSFYRALADWERYIIEKYSDYYKRSLEVAGAMIAAELDRILDDEE